MTSKWNFDRLTSRVNPVYASPTDQWACRTVKNKFSRIFFSQSHDSCRRHATLSRILWYDLAVIWFGRDTREAHEPWPLPATIFTVVVIRLASSRTSERKEHLHNAEARADENVIVSFLTRSQTQARREEEKHWKCCLQNWLDSWCLAH